jgi:hypothetical protein
MYLKYVVDGNADLWELGQDWCYTCLTYQLDDTYNLDEIAARFDGVFTLGKCSVIIKAPYKQGDEVLVDLQGSYQARVVSRNSEAGTYNVQITVKKDNVNDTLC